jgi:hypothetical protein
MGGTIEHGVEEYAPGRWGDDQTDPGRDFFVFQDSCGAAEVF